MILADQIEIDEDAINYYAKIYDQSNLKDGDVSPVIEPDTTFALDLDLMPE